MIEVNLLTLLGMLISAAVPAFGMAWWMLRSLRAIQAEQGKRLEDTVLNVGRITSQCSLHMSNDTDRHNASAGAIVEVRRAFADLVERLDKRISKLLEKVAEQEKQLGIHEVHRVNGEKRLSVIEKEVREQSARWDRLGDSLEDFLSMQEPTPPGGVRRRRGIRGGGDTPEIKP